MFARIGSRFVAFLVLITTVGPEEEKTRGRNAALAVTRPNQSWWRMRLVLASCNSILIAIHQVVTSLLGHYWCRTLLLKRYKILWCVVRPILVLYILLDIYSLIYFLHMRAEWKYYNYEQISYNFGWKNIGTIDSNSKQHTVLRHTTFN